MLAINASSVSVAGILYNTIICYNNTINVYILWREDDTEKYMFFGNSNVTDDGGGGIL